MSRCHGVRVVVLVDNHTQRRFSLRLTLSVRVTVAPAQVSWSADSALSATECQCQCQPERRQHRGRGERGHGSKVFRPVGAGGLGAQIGEDRLMGRLGAAATRQAGHRICEGPSVRRTLAATGSAESSGPT
jgi:hypothetical protein